MNDSRIVSKTPCDEVRVQNERFIASMQGTRIVLRTSEKVYVRTIHNPFRMWLSCVNFSIDGSMLLAGGGMGEVLAWDVTQSCDILLANRSPLPLAPIIEIVSSPLNTEIAVLTARQEVQVWCVTHRTILSRFSVCSSITAIEWSDEQTLNTNMGELFVVETCPSHQCHLNEVIEKDIATSSLEKRKM